MQIFCCLFYPFLQFLYRPGFIFNSKRNFTVRIHIEKLRPGILKDGAHLCGNLIHGQVADFLSVHQHAPLKFSLIKLWDQAVYQPCDRCFPTPAAATEQDTFPVCNFQADSMQTVMLLPLIRK